MSKTFKDKPNQYNTDNDPRRRKPKEGKRFVSTKGRKPQKNLKFDLDKYLET